MLDNHLLDETLVDGRQHGRRRSAGDGAIGLKSSCPVEHVVARGIDVMERLAAADPHHLMRSSR